MEKKLKKVSEGQGFICATIEEKKRIWQKLTDAGYPINPCFNNLAGKNIEVVLSDNKKVLTFMGSNDIPKHPLNESDFFDEWTPQAGDKVEVWDEGVWYCVPRIFVVKWKDLYYYESQIDGRLVPTTKIRQINPETMTLQEVREALGKPNLIIAQ
jgi:hypothetical protein